MRATINTAVLSMMSRISGSDIMEKSILAADAVVCGMKRSNSKMMARSFFILGNGVYSVLNGEGETTDRETMTNYLKTHDLYAGDANYSSLITDLYADRDNSVTFQSEYDILSSGYNAADLMIGKSVNYVSLLLTANP